MHSFEVFWPFFENKKNQTTLTYEYNGLSRALTIMETKLVTNDNSTQGFSSSRGARSAICMQAVFSESRKAKNERNLSNTSRI